jgi:5,5'-dehydrodivanillate O-demethylase
MSTPAAESFGSAVQPEDYFDHFWETKPGTIGGKYLRQFWHPVMRSVDLPPGRAKPLRLMSENYTIYRGSGGKPHLTVNRCPHRKVQLSTGWVEGDAIRCLYHGWKFDGDGRCIERPAEGTTGSITIETYPVEEYLGYIYAYVGGGTPPAFPPYPGFEAEGVIETYAAVFPCNHVQSFENDWDLYHANYTHGTGEIHGPADAEKRSGFFMELLRSTKYEETDYGVVRTMAAGPGAVNAAIFLFPATIRLLIPTFNEQSRHTGPSLRETYIAHTPIDDENHLFCLSQLVPVTGDAREAYLLEYNRVEEIKKQHPSTVSLAWQGLAGEKVLADMKQHPMLVEIEDMLTQVGQDRIVDRRGEKLGRSDAGVVFYRRLLARELDAIARGRPTKRWAYMHTVPEGTTAFRPMGV